MARRRSMDASPREIFQRLYRAWGPQGWWPGENEFEVLVGAILVQNAAWRNVERAIGDLRARGVLHPEGLRGLDQEELERLLRPVGFFRLKARRLRNLIDFLFSRYDGVLERMLATDMATLRRELLEVNGIGPETADSILLYAAQYPSFVVDTYTHRIWKRHGWIDPRASYADVKEHFEARLEPDVAVYNEFHALLVRLGHHHCRKSPRCDECPLVDLLPGGRPLDLA